MAGEIYAFEKLKYHSDQVLEAIKPKNFIELKVLPHSIQEKKIKPIIEKVKVLSVDKEKKKDLSFLKNLEDWDDDFYLALNEE
mmetsp:Transcript_10044/g.8567  ORF Transcript_10044/g.8567 Transcript_10044/m.8567 type:complete len:83 (+) Transcript_10044:108-356(+)